MLCNALVFVIILSSLATKIKIMKTNKKWSHLFQTTVLIGWLFSLDGCSDNDMGVIPSDSPEDQRKVTFYNDLQQVLDHGVDNFKGKGISAAVILPDGSTWMGVSGVSYGSVSIETDMRFGAGSITKNFTAAALLKLAEEGKLNLDDTLDKWLPSYPNVDSTITIRQLLNHTSGLNDIADNIDFWAEIFRDPSRSWIPEEIISLFNNEPVFPKGTDWNYSTTGYILLRSIIQKITGSDICSVYNNLFFIPYGLSNTFASIGDGLPARTAHGWFDLDNDGDYDDFYYWPRNSYASSICGEVFSTAEDLAKWIKVLYRDKTVLSQESLNQMLSFHSPCTGEEYMCAGYGLGAIKFNPDLFNGLEAIGHSGNALGYAAVSFYLTDYDVCIGLVDNTDEGNSMYLVNDMIYVIQDYLEE
jgi:D-alanyl-D-alanine carboxypeptidase